MIKTTTLMANSLIMDPAGICSDNYDEMEVPFDGLPAPRLDPLP